jgi:hypothetical protein
LTARVAVNRVWLQHFGAGLVRTPSDFGLRSEPPSHPELLDWLAATFVREGWSFKKLHRLILLSAAWQQTTEGDRAFAERDPDNRLLWRQNRRRLDFEAMRDTLLEASGGLDLAMGGQAVEITTRLRPAPQRYMVERRTCPAFDFASPDTTSAQRFQPRCEALFFMNSAFADRAAPGRAPGRGEADTAPDALCQIVFQRRPGAGKSPSRRVLARADGGRRTPVAAPSSGAINRARRRRRPASSWELRAGPPRCRTRPRLWTSPRVCAPTAGKRSNRAKTVVPVKPACARDGDGALRGAH